MKNLWGVLLGLAGGLLGAGVIFLVTRTPVGEPVELLPPPEPPPVIVHVAGEVAAPGVYSLPAGSRVQDAIGAAGGSLPDAGLDNLNLATLLEDGQRLWVPSAVPTPEPETSGGERSQTVELPTGTPSSQNPININTASAAELESLPKIGPVIAQAIIDYRQANGPFSAIEEIIEVKGIGPAIFEAIKELITVEGP